MTKKTLLATTLLVIVPALLRADITFTFNEVGSDVVMTSSGTLDTTKLVAATTSGWGGTGLESRGVGDIDIMGSSVLGGIDQSFKFHVGTDISALINPVGPFAFDSFSGWVVTEGVKSFATYAEFAAGDFRVPGISLLSSDVENGFWTPDQKWINANTTLAALGLNTGVYSVVDNQTGETITIQINEGISRTVPVPDGGATVALLGVALTGLAMLRRRGQA